MTAFVSQWKDWAAIAAAQGNVWAFEGAGNSWHPDQNDSPTFLNCEANNISIFFPIPYEKGSLLTRLRVKHGADAADHGVKVSLLYRDEDSSDTAWTLHGAEQTYTIAAVTVSVYDFADLLMLENYSYMIKVKSVSIADVCRLYSVGIETRIRLL